MQKNREEKSNKFKKQGPVEDPEETKRQLDRIHRLAVRLPWIVLIITTIAMILILIQALLQKSG